MKNARRKFIKHIAGLSAGLSLAPSYDILAKSRVIGANERIRVGVIGCGRITNAHIRALMEIGAKIRSR